MRLRWQWMFLGLFVLHSFSEPAVAMMPRQVLYRWTLMVGTCGALLAGGVYAVQQHQEERLAAKRSEAYRLKALDDAQFPGGVHFKGRETKDVRVVTKQSLTEIFLKKGEQTLQQQDEFWLKILRGEISDSAKLDLLSKIRERTLSARVSTELRTKQGPMIPHQDHPLLRRHYSDNAELVVDGKVVARFQLEIREVGFYEADTKVLRGRYHYEQTKVRILALDLVAP